MRFALVLALASLGLSACGSSSTPVGPADMAVTVGHDAAADLAGPHADGKAVYTCGDGYTCNNNCGGDQTCGQSCLNMINTPNGQKLFMAVEKCFSLAAQGMCASSCMTASQACGVCVYMACASDVSNCNQDM